MKQILKKSTSSELSNRQQITMKTTNTKSRFITLAV